MRGCGYVHICIYPNLNRLPEGQIRQCDPGIGIHQVCSFLNGVLVTNNSIYLDAGMTDTSFREAARAANLDYANYSSHLFLANSFNELRDPKQINLRYETPWLSEFLIANLLAPVEAGTF